MPDCGASKLRLESPNEFLIELERSLRSELVEISELEADFWSMKACISWVVEGDKNTAFFHTSTLMRRRRNHIVSMKDRMGNWLNNEQDIAIFIRRGFLELFTTSYHSSSLEEWHPPFWQCELKSEDIEKLIILVNDSEIFSALKSLKPYKAPGPDGLHARFLQCFWLILGESVKEEVKNIFCLGRVPNYLNNTLITLIPKCKSPESFNHHRPIGLCNSVYKVVTKIIVRCIRTLLVELVSPLQTAFVPRRKGVDNAIIVHELINSMLEKKGKEGLWLLKLIWKRPMTVLNGVLLEIP